jgi:hypothetical protein
MPPPVSVDVEATVSRKPPPPPGGGGIKVRKHILKQKRAREVPVTPGYKPPGAADLPDLSMPEFAPPKRGTKRQREDPDPKFTPKRRLNPDVEKPAPKATRKYGPRDKEPPPITGKRKADEPSGSVLRKPKVTGQVKTKPAVRVSGYRKPQQIRGGSSAPSKAPDKQLSKTLGMIKEKPKAMRSASQPVSFWIGT